MEPGHGAVDAPENGATSTFSWKKLRSWRLFGGRSKRAELVDIGEIIFSHILPTAMGYLGASWAKPVAIEAVL